MNKNKTSLIWEKYDAERSHQRPTGREGHVLVYLNDKNKYFIFSGISHTRFSDVYTLSVADWTWEVKVTSGEVPKELAYCGGWYDAPYFFFYGGRNKEIAMTDTYFLNTDTWVWSKVFTMDQPTSRYHHAIVKTNNKEAFLFGGFNEKTNQCLGDLYRYDYKYLQFQSTEKDKVTGSSWINVYDIGTKPAPRRGHTMVFYNGTLIVYGGLTDKGFDDERFYQYTIDYKLWKALTISGVKPGCRVYHSMNFFTQDTLVIFGGQCRTTDNLNYEVSNDLLMLDLKELNCTAPFIANIGPSPRYGHSSSYNTHFTPAEHLIVGGLDKTFCTMDAYVLKEVSLDSDKKWVYEQKKMHSSTNTNYENKDDIFETAKRTIISYKNELEKLESDNIEINRK